LLAVQKLKPTIPPSQEGDIEEVVVPVQVSQDSKSTVNHDPSENSSEDIDDEYMQLQLRIFKLAIFITAFAVLISAIFLGLKVGISLLTGACSGILYLRLLARGIGKLGKTSMSVSKTQLLVPVLLFFLVSRSPELELLPALLGFLIYKLSLIVQFVFQPLAEDLLNK